MRDWRRTLLHVVGYLLLLTGLLTLFFVLMTLSVIGMEGRHPDDMKRLIWGLVIAGGSLSWLQIATGRGLRRRFHYGFFLGVVLSCALPALAAWSAIQRGSFLFAASLTLCGIGLGALLRSVRATGVFQPAPREEIKHLASSALVIGLLLLVTGSAAESLMRARRPSVRVMLPP
jgi:hypothetical protein